jgi:hypothetical protein
LWLHGGKKKVTIILLEIKGERGTKANLRNGQGSHQKWKTDLNTNKKFDLSSLPFQGHDDGSI